MESRGKTARELAVLVQVAISVALLIDAAAFTSLYSAQRETHVGYDESAVILAPIQPKDSRTFRGDLPALYAEASSRLGSVNGIDRVAVATGGPLRGSGWFGTVSNPEIAARVDADAKTSLQAIGPDYFRTIGASMLRGREFTPTDRAGTPSDADRFDVAVVNDVAARKFWPGVDPLGRRVVVDGSTATVIGVVSDIHDVSTVTVVPRVYLPMFETSARELTLVIHARGDTAVAMQAVRTAIDGSTLLRPTVPQTLRSIREGILAPSRVASGAFAAIASIALSLACIGLYGLIAMWTAHRRRELGIRLALGSTTAAVHRLLLKESGSILLTGLALGAALGVILLLVERSWLGPYLRIDASFAALALSSLVGAVLGAVAVAITRGIRGATSDLLR